MTRVVFYLLPGESPNERQGFACRLAEKAYRAGHKVYIHTESESQSKVLDDLLWTFRAGSFVPHVRRDESTPTADQPVVIGNTPSPPDIREIIINLSTVCPDPLEGVGRVLEILNRSVEVRQAGRTRYRHYQQLGLEIETHDMAAQEDA